MAMWGFLFVVLLVVLLLCSAFAVNEDTWADDDEEDWLEAANIKDKDNHE